MRGHRKSKNGEDNVRVVFLPTAEGTYMNRSV